VLADGVTKDARQRRDRLVEFWTKGGVEASSGGLAWNAAAGEKIKGSSLTLEDSELEQSNLEYDDIVLCSDQLQLFLTTGQVPWKPLSLGLGIKTTRRESYCTVLVLTVHTTSKLPAMHTSTGNTCISRCRPAFE